MLPLVLRIGPVSIHSFGVLMMLAFVLATFVFWKRAREEYLDEGEAIDLVFTGVFWALLVARLMYVLVNFGDFGLNVLEWLAFWQKPGLVWEGLMLGGLVAVIKFVRQKKWNLFKVLDLMVIGLALAHSLLHLGLFLSGSNVGTATQLPWGVRFPGVFEQRHPVGVYGFMLWMNMFFLLWWLEGRYRKFIWYQRSKGDAREGFLTFVYVIALGVIGLVLEIVSESSVRVGGVPVDLLERIGLIVGGTLGLYLRSGLSFSQELEEFGMSIRQRIKGDQWSKSKRRH